MQSSRTKKKRSLIKFNLQAAHETDEIEDQVPTGQLTQVRLELAPINDENWPAIQSTHTLIELAPTVDDHFAARQLTHEVAPITDDHLPAAQSRQ